MLAGRRRVTVRAFAWAASVLVLTAGTALVLFVNRHRDAAPVSETAAQGKFDRLRAQFGGQTPLVDMRARSARSLAAQPNAQPLRAFHTIIFDRRGGDRLVEINVPYWLGRKYARHNGSFALLGELSFLDDTEVDPEPLQLSIRDIERHGAGLLVDYRHPGGGQFLAWVD